MPSDEPANMSQQGAHPERAEQALAAWRQACWRPWSLALARQACRLLLVSGQWSLLARSTLLGWHDPRSRALARFMMRCPPDQPSQLPSHPQQVISTAAWIGMVKDEADVLFANLLWHHHLGLRRFYVLDNGCRDATMTTVMQFKRWHPQADVRVVQDPDPTYFQARKMTAAAREAMRCWPDVQWLFPIDADEFLCARKPLSEILASISASTQAVLLPKAIYRASDMEDLEPTAPFWRRLSVRGALGAVSCKSIMRADPRLALGRGNHEVLRAGGRQVRRWTSHPDLTMREYPTRSFAHFRYKALKGSEAIAKAQAQGLGGVKSHHWVARHQVWLNEGDAGLRRLLHRNLQLEHQRQGLFDPLPLNALFEALMARLQPADQAELHTILALTHSAFDPSGSSPEHRSPT